MDPASPSAPGQKPDEQKVPDPNLNTDPVQEAPASPSQPVVSSQDPVVLPVDNATPVQPQNLTSISPSQQPAMPWDKPAGQEAGTSSNPQPVTAFGATSVDPSQPKSKKKLFIIIAGVLAGLVLLGGGIAAAYVGVVLPNKPENVLKQALANTLKEEEMTIDGQLEMKAADSTKADAMPAVKASYNGKFDGVEKASELTLKVTVSGVDFPLDIRYVDGNAYAKVGDISALTALAGGYASSFGLDQAQLEPLVRNVSKLISNQWIVFDSTLLTDSGVSCIADANLAFTDQDIELLGDLYTKHSFAQINNHSDDTVSGKSAIKYEMSIDDNKMAKFIEDKKLEELSFLKALKKCQDTEKLDTSGFADNDTTPITLWVDKDTKRIVKLASQSTKQDAQKSNFEAAISATVAYNEVSVIKPENAKPAMQLWGELQQEFSNIFGSGLPGASFEGEEIITDTEYLYDESITQ